MVALSLYLPTWATDELRRRRRVDARTSIVLTRTEHRVEVVAAACARARRAGVTIGMTVAHARALMPGRGLIEPIDDERARAALARLARWLLRCVPVVALDTSEGTIADPGLMGDATGCERLYRGLEVLVDRVYARVRGVGIEARLAAAPTYGAAWALARFGVRSPMIVSADEVLAALAGLPAAALRLDSGVVEALRQVGVGRVGELLALPRDGVAARYGAGTLRRIDQALGHAEEAITPIRPREVIRAALDFDGPTDRVESVLLAARDVLGRVAMRLRELESGCRGLELTLARSDLTPVAIVVRTARPTRDAKHLWSLLATKVERAHLGFGVLGVGLRAGGVCRIRHEQGGVGAWGVPTRASDAIARLVDTLNARLGVGRVLRARAVESHVPERAYRIEPVVEVDEAGARVPACDADRPSRLYDVPRRAEVVLLVPDGPIASIWQAGRSERVVASLGPERIAPEWWRGDDNGGGPRDYYKVLTETGRALWMYRDGRGWAVHGVWA